MDVATFNNIVRKIPVTYAVFLLRKRPTWLGDEHQTKYLYYYAGSFAYLKNGAPVLLGIKPSAVDFVGYYTMDQYKLLAGG